MQREPEALRVNLIDGGDAPVDERTVLQLMESMRTLGLINPISVRYFEDTPSRVGTDDSTIVVTGRHRLEAAKRLGWTEIECFVVDYDDLHAELAEIDENLIRRVLTAAQEASAISRRKAIYVEIHKETEHGGNKSGPSAQFAHTEAESFSENTANATGKHRSTIDRAAARGEALGSDLDAVTGTSLDKGVELDALAKMEPEERAALIERAKAGEKVSARTHDIAYLQQEADCREAERRNGTANRVVEMGSAEGFAEWLLGRIDLNELDVLISWLQGTKAKDVIAALHRRAA